jgi:scyllo-inositol 2-dehydrogenase (NADP+)
MAYRTGIIGYGGMGRDYHFKRVSELTDCVKVRAVFDIRESARQRAREDGLIAYDNIGAFLSDPEIDIVVIATPNHVHKKYAVAAMRAGKNVICEKPVTMNAAEMHEILDVRNETGKQFAVHQNRRWDGGFRKLKIIVESGLIGELFYIKHRVHGTGGAIGGWRSDVSNGGGFLMDWGIHLLDRTIWLMRQHKIIEVNGIVKKLRSMTDDNAIVNITFDNGCRLLVETMMYAGFPEPLFEVHGDRGAFILKDEDDEGRVLVSEITGEKYVENLVYREQGPVPIRSRVLQEKFREISAPDTKIPSDMKAGNDWVAFYNNFTAALDGREDLIVTPEQSLRLMKVMDMINASATTGRSIACCL